MATRRGRRPNAPQMFPKSLVQMSVSSSAIEGLRALERGIKEKVLRSAAYAGAVVFYNEMRLRVPVNEGTLYGSIYHYHLEKQSHANRQMYAIGPNKKKAPHWYNVEYGHWRVNVVRRQGGRWIATKERLPEPKWVPGVPYVRPTFDAKKQAAIAAMNVRFEQRLREVMSEIAT
jgi:hypothetical protein